MKEFLKSRKNAGITIISVLLILVLLINVLSAVFLSFSLLKKDGWERFEEYLYGRQLSTASEWISEKSEKIQVVNSEGEELNGLKIKNEHVSHSYILICHQYGGSPEAMEEYARHFYDLGFNIILPYMRGHAESPYNKISFGWQDKSDIINWIEKIIKEDKKAKIALFGVSLGANAVTLAATEELPTNVRLVISDSCYTSLDDLMKAYIKNETKLSSLIVRGVISAYVKNKIGESLKNANTVSQLKNIELPIIFINGEDDAAVPPLVSKLLYENCDAEGVEEVVIENGTHGRNLEADTDAYWENIDIFILNYLGI
ncbi:MAG: alpha/beta hydrolase [Clostridia bacterium]|nr:alpha/beta hydrolase [Clostridia bacterium]